jgi:hypothetical protein
LSFSQGFVETGAGGVQASSTGSRFSFSQGRVEISVGRVQPNCLLVIRNGEDVIALAVVATPPIEIAAGTGRDESNEFVELHNGFVVILLVEIRTSPVVDIGGNGANVDFGLLSSH